MDRLSSLTAFVQAVDLGGFAAAARQLRLSPAMVGKHVAFLEAQLGTRLLHRTTRRLTLTDAGRIFYDRAVRILREFEDAVRLTASYQENPEGLLRVTAPVALASRLAPLMADFASTYSKVRLDIICNDRVVDLVEQGFDLAIRVGRLPDSSLIARKLAPAPAIVCASPAYLQRRGIPNGLEDLKHHDCIAYEHQWAGGGWAFSNADRSGEIVVRLPAVAYRTNNLDVQRAMVLAGKGIAQLPLFSVEADIAAGRILPILEDVPTLERWLHAVYPPGRQIPLSLRVLVDFLVERFK